MFTGLRSIRDLAQNKEGEDQWSLFLMMAST